MLMEQFLAPLKKENPDINCGFYRQDNAGCYYATNTILDISERTGIYVEVWTFLTPREEKDLAINLLQP